MPLRNRRRPTVADMTMEGAANGEPEHAAKRVRFAMTVRANDAVHLAIVGDVAQVEARAIDYFSPAFTYHAFGKEELIEGFDGLRLEVLFNAYDFSAMLNVSYNHQEARYDDVVEKIQSSLPAGFTQDEQTFLSGLREAREDFTPPGIMLQSYAQEIDGRTHEFEIYECALDKNERAQQLHEKLQTMALWFIEGADAIDVTDPRWVVYIIYERLGEGGRLLPVGFLTLFKFTNPLGRKGVTSTATETHRICQALIFPTHQRQGHCERLVDLIYGKVQADSNVYEVTVEDPVPGFSKLRDYVDTKHCMRHKFFSLAPSESSDDAAPATRTASLQQTDIQTVQEKLKLTQRQIQRCYELLKLRFIDKSNDDEYKKYRLEVKKRLFKLHAEDVEGMGTERRKAFLETEYKLHEELYGELLAKLLKSQPSSE